MPEVGPRAVCPFQYSHLWESVLNLNHLSRSQMIFVLTDEGDAEIFSTSVPGHLSSF